MRPVRALLLVIALGPVNARAADFRHFDDAALRAIQFVDRNEGWAVGDEGCVWHSIDGGRSWERQPTGVRASLRSLHFLNPYTGWAVGREELPHGGGSVGVLLFTDDGGLKWRRGATHVLPGLNRVQFLSEKTGFVVGDGTDAFPSGVFKTTDGGRTWLPVPGPRVPAWLGADFQNDKTGTLVGAWMRPHVLRESSLAEADVDMVRGRSLHAVQVVGPRAVAVGQGGLVMLSRDTAGARWGYADLTLPTEVRSSWDFHAVHCVGDRIWAAGRPGSAVLHSADGGQTWSVQKTGQPLPLHGIFFLKDGLHGWAVGELGMVLATSDGGKSWRIQRRGGARAAVLLVHARSAEVPLDSVAQLGGEEGYLTAAVRVVAADPASAAPRQAADGHRLAAAVRSAGGAAGELLWQFPQAQHQAEKAELTQAWDQLYADRGAEELVRQMVLALRIWRPSVVLTDPPDEKVSGSAAEALVGEALQQAFRLAGDPKAFPEQIQQLGLEPWEVAKLYARWHNAAGAQIMLDLNEVSPRLEASPRDFAGAAATLLADAPASMPSPRMYRLLASRVEGAAAHRTLMQGVNVAAGGSARRTLAPLKEMDAEVVKAARARRNLQALAEVDAGKLTDPNRLLAQVVPTLANLPEHQGAPAAFAVANQYARMGQWTLAREVFLALVDRYPAHPLAADAYRWLIRHNTSSEARRRHELNQFAVVAETSTRAVDKAGRRPGDPEMELVTSRQLALLSDLKETRQWYRGGLEVGDRLATLGPLHAADPAVQFCLQAARRQLGEVEAAQKWYTRFRDQNVPERGPAGDPWRLAAAGEVWLASCAGQPPRPVALCRQTAARPFLDGKFDDECWQELKPLVFRNAAGATLQEYPTEARFAYDKDFLYLALRCRHPADRHVPPVDARPRDADLRGFDRVSLLLDLDRDYSTYFHLQMDQRGCVAEDCWGDRTWDPRWFVAVHSDKDSWQIEAAVPLHELTGDPVTVGRAWACNLVRVLPGRGVQAFSLPADVRPRPEGMGLLLFAAEPKKER